MMVKRFIARTSREAMARIRAELGNDAVVLKTRNVEGGVEVMAMIEGEADAFDVAPLAPVPPAPEPEIQAPPIVAPAIRPVPVAVAAPEPVQTVALPAAPAVAASASTASSMSTLSFQQFVRKRLAGRKAPADVPAQAAAPAVPGPAQGGAAVAAAAPTTSSAILQEPTRPISVAAVLNRVEPRMEAAPQAAVEHRAEARPEAMVAEADAAFPATEPMRIPRAGAGRPESVRAASEALHRALPGGARRAEQEPDAGAGAPAPEPVAIEASAPPTLVEMLAQAAGGHDDGNLMSELREMRGLISSQLSSLARFDSFRRNPVQVRLLRQLIASGYSPILSRKLIERLPSDFHDADAEGWLRRSLSRLVRQVEPGKTLLETGGIFALVGPTGVGKTTTTAKIAAQFALRYGVDSVGLLTVDAYRIGAQDQLRTFGRLLGVPVHVVHDAAGLAEFMSIFMRKKLVLIDTVGVGQRDERLSGLLASLSARSIQRLLVLNAAAQTETLEEVISAYRGESLAGAVVSKLDEAVKPGGVTDCLIRHRLPLVGMADGQRVPEDWHFPDPVGLVERSLEVAPNPAFDLEDNEISLLVDGLPGEEGPRAGEAFGV